jgi:ArsR family transcriptional regulator, arsenate/arsenite/antimonite-responsive transcriptional repressor
MFLDTLTLIDTTGRCEGSPDMPPALLERPADDPVACCAPLGAPALSEQEARATAELFKALADPARVRIVNLLARSGAPVCACNLNEPVGLAQPTVSHHLKKLTDAGLVEREQRGKWAYFSLRRDAVERLAGVANLKGACC